MAQPITSVENEGTAVAAIGTANFLGDDQGTGNATQGGTVNVTNREKGKVGLLIGSATFGKGRDVKATGTEVTVNTAKYGGSNATSSTPKIWEDEDMKDEYDSTNCWLCSIDGKNIIEASELFRLIDETGSADLNEVLQTYKINGAGEETEVKTFAEWNDLIKYLDEILSNSLKEQAKETASNTPKAKLKVLFGYRAAGPNFGHMLVLKALKRGNEKVHTRTIDFKKDSGDPHRITQDKMPVNARPGYIIVETKHDTY